MLAMALSGCDKIAPTTAAAPKVAYRGADITGADYARTLSLPDVNGQVRTLSDFKGKVLSLIHI